jgi:hypothetical protein
MARKATTPKDVERLDAVGPQPPDGKAVSKAEAVRAAIDAGMETPDEGIAFVKTHYGLEITKPHFSAVKSDYKKRSSAPPGRPGRKPRAAVEGYLAPPPRPATDDAPDLLAAMEAIKPLVASLGPDRVKRIVDLLG